MIIQFLGIFPGTAATAGTAATTRGCRTTRFIRVLLGRRLAASWLIPVALLGMGVWAVPAQSHAADVMTTLPHMQSVAAPEFPADLQWLHTTQLPLRGLTPPEPPADPLKTAQPDSLELGEVMRLSEQSLPPLTQTKMQLVLHAPKGWQVNGRAPGLLKVTVQGKGAEVPATYAKQTVRPMPPELDIPVQTAAAGAAALLRVDLSFVLCRKGDQAVCVPRQVAWEVVVRSQSQAAQTTLILHDRMATIARDFAD